MGKKFSHYYLFILLSCCGSFAVSQSVNLPSSSLNVLHYVFRLTIHDYTDEIQGDADIFVSLPPQVSNPIILHLDHLDNQSKQGMTIDALRFNNKPVKFAHKNHTLYIDLPSGIQGSSQGTFRISYHGVPKDGLIIEQNQYGDRTFFGDNWPNRAHFWLPTNDHPSDKATCEFIVTAPSHYQVISNGTLREESLLLPTNENITRYKITHWATPHPIPTKVMVFGAARFAIQYPIDSETTTLENWLYPEDREIGFKQFSPTADILAYYESILGPYPFKKLANVQSKTQYGGMENASAIFYNEKAITNRPSIEALIAHEIAHQWFGNSVTEQNWSDVWLSEGFSTYLTHLYIEQTYGRDSMAARLLSDKDRIFSFHMQSPASKVVSDDESNLFQLLNANTYQKGAWVLHMLRSKVGDKIFFKLLRQFYKKYQYKNASTQDFISLANKLSGQNLSPFFAQWLSRSDYPIIQGEWKYSAMGKKLTLTLEQVQASEVYSLLLDIGLYSDNKANTEIKRIVLDERKKTFTFKVKSKINNVVVDPNTLQLQDNTISKK